jgi:hypothetical protein
VWCWGRLGNAAKIYGNTMGAPPAPQTGLAGPVQALTTGGEEGMSCALLTTGAVQCWGQADGYLGDGDRVRRDGITNGEYSARPVNVLPAGSGAVEIRSGDSHACVLLANGGVTCWGFSTVPMPVLGL